MIVLCSKLLRSNIRTLPSCPQLTNTSTLFAQKRTSYTSLSCAINCVLAVKEGISQIVHVVSMLDVMIRLGETVFQSSEVSGAVWSGVFELDKSARGVSLVVAASRFRLVMELPGLEGVSEGKDHSLKWSPEVASRSVDCFVDEGGSHSSRVTGKECVASAILVKSIVHFEPPCCEYTSDGVGVTWVSRIWICEINISNRLVRARPAETHEIVAVFKVASNGNFASAIALGRPLAPIERIRCPWCHVIAGTLCSILRAGKVKPTCQAIGQR